VPKTTHIPSALFKAWWLAMFSLLFFVHTQAAFVYYAYNNDFAPVHHTARLHKAGNETISAGTLTDTHKHFKLNKRYQAVTPYAIVPAPVTITVYQCKVRAKWLVPPVLASTHFLYIKPLRGPPVV